MKITVSEGLRLKNEISKIVKNLEYKSKTEIVLGQTIEDGVVSTDNNDYHFENIYPKLEKALDYSEEINNKIANFNRENKIDAKIRKFHNLKLKKDVLEYLIPYSKPKITNKWTTVGNTRKKIVIEYKPSVNSKDLKKRVKEFKKEIRAIQVYVEASNNKKIELSFEYSDIDNLTIE